MVTGRFSEELSWDLTKLNDYINTLKSPDFLPPHLNTSLRTTDMKNSLLLSKISKAANQGGMVKKLI